MLKVVITIVDNSIFINFRVCLERENPRRHEPPIFAMQHRASAMEYTFVTNTSKVFLREKEDIKKIDNTMGSTKLNFRVC